jgi:hypothetical protein
MVLTGVVDGFLGLGQEEEEGNEIPVVDLY